MTLWLFAIYSIWSFWLRPASSGCGVSKIRVLDDIPQLRLPSYTERLNQPLARGAFPGNVRKVFDAHPEAAAFGPEDGLTRIVVHISQPELPRPPDNRQFVLRVFEGPMKVIIDSLHIRYVADGKLYDGIRTSAKFNGENNLHFGPYVYDFPLTCAKDLVTFDLEDVPAFDIDDALRAMRKNWNRRIHFLQFASNQMSMSITRAPMDDPIRALRDKFVIHFTIADYVVRIAPGDGPEFEHIHAISKQAMDSDKLEWIMRPPQWLERAESREADQWWSEIS